MNAAPPPVPAVNRTAWIALALVALVNAVSLLDRQILAILAPAIKADLKVGDAEMGLLYGTVFALFYALFSLPLGRLADGWVRTRLLTVADCLLVGRDRAGGLCLGLCHAGDLAPWRRHRRGCGSAGRNLADL